MYNQPDCLPALDRYWAMIRDRLHNRGCAAPDALTWGVTNFAEHWLRPDLVLSQTCGMPYRTLLHGKVTLIGTPDFGVEGCPPGHYRSVFVVRADETRSDLRSFADARFALNDTLSQSGWAGPQTHAASLGFQFETVVPTGAHTASAQAVMEGRADIAAIDAVSWRFMQRNDASLAALRSIGHTPPTPGLPYIAAKDAPRDALNAAIAGAIAALDGPDRATLGLKGLVAIPARTYLDVPNPAPITQNAH